jgi:hypothetical protein
MSFVITHIPHIIPVLLVWGILIRFWLAQRRLEREGGPGSASTPAQTALPVATATLPTRSQTSAAAAPVRRGVALRGLIALGPLIGALATGLVIYALNLGVGHAGDAAIWIHVGISLLALLLVFYKIAEIGRARLRESLTHARVLRTGGSIVLLALWVPLLVSGVVLLIAPSTASFTAYAHLIASVWWTGLLLWHLRRYLLRAGRAVLARPAEKVGVGSVGPGGPVGPVAGAPVRTQPALPARRRSRGGRVSRPGRAPGIATGEAIDAATEDSASVPSRRS